MPERGATSSYFVLFLLLLVLAQGAYVGIGLYLAPTVANVLPNPARAGSVITIHGTNFASDAWDNAVLFGNQSGKVTRTTASTIEVELPPPTVTLASPRVADLFAEAATAESARRYHDAVALYEKVLAVEPGNAKAQAARKTAQGAAAALSKTFHPGKTLVEGPTVARGNFKEFDTREVAMRKAPEVPGSIVFEISPGRLLGGDPYAVKVYLQNEGTKPIRIASMKVTTTVNGNAATAAVPGRPGEIASKGRALVHETQGVWKEGTTSWTLDVQISSAKGDSYRNQADWK